MPTVTAECVRGMKTARTRLLKSGCVCRMCCDDHSNRTLSPATQTTPRRWPPNNKQNFYVCQHYTVTDRVSGQGNAIGRVRPSVSRALRVTTVDHCSSVLSGISGQLLQRLQSVFNAAALSCSPQGSHSTLLRSSVNYISWKFRR